MRIRRLWAAVLVAGWLIGCGGDDGDSGSSGSGGSSSGDTSGTGGVTADTPNPNGLPNSCELFTEADTAEYGGLGEPKRTMVASDHCIYTDTVDGQVRQISIDVFSSSGYSQTVEDLDAIYIEDDFYSDAIKTPGTWGEESVIYQTEPGGGGAVLVRQEPYTVWVSTKGLLEADLRAIVEKVLSRL